MGTTRDVLYSNYVYDICDLVLRSWATAVATVPDECHYDGGTYSSSITRSGI